jgi:large-conductance mechanosensitive channel
MTLSISPGDAAEIVSVAATVFSILLMLIIGWFVYLMVRPSRKERERRRAREADPAEAEELWRIVDLMERRLALLERALAGRLEDQRKTDFLLADEGRESGRKE